MHLAILVTALATLSAAPPAHARGDRSPDHGRPSSQPQQTAPTACSTAACGNDPCLQQGTCVAFSNLCWTIKDSNGGEVGPGPNIFSKNNVSVDDQCRLHLRIAQQNGNWTTAEVIGRASFGYGTYQVVYDTPVDDFDPNVVLALFTWSNSAAHAHREIDIEFSRWGNAGNPNNAQYVVQPSTPSSRIFRWLVPGAVPSTHSFRWQPGSVFFESFAGTTHQQWNFTGKVPIPGGENPRMNLWLFRGAPPTDGQPVEVIVRSFSFTR
jgi:hypothetical protein